MAARTSSSVGMLVLVTILSIASLGLFVTTVVFFAKARAADDRARNAETATSEIINDVDRQNATLTRYKDLGKKDKPAKTAVGYLLAQQEAVMRRVTGSPSDTLDNLNKALGEGSSGSSVLAILKDKQGEVESLKKQLADAQAGRQQALTDKENEAGRVRQIEEAQKQAGAGLVVSVNQTKADADRMREEVTSFKGDMDTRVEHARAEFGAKEAALQQEIDKLQRERVLDKGRLATAEALQRGSRFTGANEASLVDGTVIALNAGDGTVTLSIGRKNKVALGLTFEVYADSTAIRPDAKTNEYPRGKGTIEVISVDQETSTARILREQKGNPLVRGDVIANAIYDPNKSYKFLVYGNFDPQHTGIATSLGAADIKARIKAWGGGIVDELAGDVDFVVLGQRPVLPPEPTANAPIEVVQEYIRLQKLARHYDELLTQATATSIPVLNENRLYTLTGGGM